MEQDWQTIPSKNKNKHVFNLQSKQSNECSKAEKLVLPSRFNLSQNNEYYQKDSKRVNVLHSNVSTTLQKSNITRYIRDDIFKYKIINKENQVTYELSLIFDKINDMFKTSTQYIESKKKINYNQSNHNKWELKKDEDNSIINIICSGFNKITKENYNQIFMEISIQEIILLY